MAGNSARDVVTGFYADFDRGDVDAALASCSEELEVTDPGMGTVQGLEPFREYLTTFKRAMPDAHVIVEDIVEVDGTVVVEGRFAGTHTGPLAGPDGDIDPTGASLELRFADVSRIRDGKIASYHTYYDQVALLTQLGLMDG